MEKLTAAQQQLVKKMSIDRLRVKLMSAGFEEEAVMAMERDDLLASYVEVLANPKLVVNPVGAVAVDPELERERLAFERQKWEAEKRRWEADREDRKRAEDLELQKLEVEHRRWTELEAIQREQSQIKKRRWN